ncbi:hypothetical protein F2P81_000090 [Scophthalmus maximus]|uniref:C2H2-type domain-containing protein n=1 Tax=Scophthalmus maximus TaxID=52904 RepID=A0A6A4TIB5_SCOMX|nr:hypothetical protein F2P81_000090 [Scophthalmus maximus]
MEPNACGQVTVIKQRLELKFTCQREKVLERDVASSSVSHQETSPVMPAASETTEPTDATTAVIKVEDEDEYEDKSWSQSEQDDGFRCVGDAQTTQTEAPPPPSKQEAADEDGDSSQRRTGEEVSSTSTSVQKTLNGSHQRAETDGYDFLMHEAQLQHGPRSTHNPRREDPGCSYVLNSSLSSVSFDSGSGGSFPADVSEASASEQPAVFTDSQQRAPTARDEPRRPVTGRRDDFIRRDRWRHRRGEDSGGKAFVCNCCGKTLACLKNLKTHMRVHTGEKPFVCTLCGKRFSDSSNLKRHQSVHTGEKRYGCAHCGKRFAQSGSLKVHMSVHTDCKQFRCSFCGRTFISSSHLRRHVAVHAGEKRFAHTLH